MTMTGLWLEEGRLSLRRDLPIPSPPAGEASVRVLTAGICNTDLELVRGYYPFRGVPGHEFVGIVEEGPAELAGRRVVGEINAVCGVCRVCRASWLGHATHCEKRTVLGIVGRDGAFAEVLSLPVENLHPVPDSVTTERAVFTEPLAAALEIRQQIQVRPEDRVLVIGDGKLGLLVAQTLALTGCDLLAVGRHPAKLALLADRGIRIALAGEEADGVKVVKAVERGVFDLAVECTGNQGGFETARRALRPRGTLVMKSTYAGDLTFDASSLVVDEITLVGSRCGPFAPALELLAQGKVDVEPLIHSRYPLAEGVAAFDQARRPGVLKILLEIGEAWTKRGQAPH